MLLVGSAWLFGFSQKNSYLASNLTTMKRTIFLLATLLFSALATSAQTIRITYQNGRAWQTATIGEVTLSVSHDIIRDYGKWHRLQVMITNHGANDIYLNPTEAFNASLEQKGALLPLEIWSHTDYTKKIKRKQTASLGLSVATTGAATYLGVSDAGRHNEVLGGVVGAGTAVTTGMQVNRQQRESRTVKELGYLKRNTILGGQTVSGYLLIKYTKGDILYLETTIDGATFRYRWNTSGKYTSDPILPEGQK